MEWLETFLLTALLRAPWRWSADNFRARLMVRHALYDRTGRDPYLT